MAQLSDAKWAYGAQKQQIGEAAAAADGRRRPSLENAAAEAPRARIGEQRELLKGRLRSLADEIALRETELLNARFAEAKVHRELKLEEKAERAREVSGLDKFAERKAQRERLREEITRKEEELLNTKRDHSEELRRASLCTANASAGADAAAAGRTAGEPASAPPEKTAFDRPAELHRLREEHAEQLHKAALEDRLRRAESFDHTDRVLRNKEAIDAANAEKARQHAERLVSRTNDAAQMRRASIDDVTARAHQSLAGTRHAESREQLEERSAALVRDGEVRLKAADERRQASLVNVAAKAHKSAGLEKHAENRERLDAEFEKRVVSRLREEEERSAAAYQRRRLALEEVAAKAHQAADLPRYAEIRAQLNSLAEERRKRRKEELEARAAAAFERRKMSLENVAKAAHVEVERVSQNVVRYEEMQKHKLDMLVAEQKLMDLHTRDVNTGHEEAASRNTLSFADEGVPVPQNTPAEHNYGSKLAQ